MIELNNEWKTKINKIMNSFPITHLIFIVKAKFSVSSLVIWAIYKNSLLSCN